MISEGNKKYFFLSAASGEGDSRKEAMQRSLERTGLANLDMPLHRSIMVTDMCIYSGKRQILSEQPIEACFVSLSSNSPGQMIAAAIGAGIPDDDNSPVLVKSFSGLCTEEEAALELEGLLTRSSLEGKIQLKQILIKAIQHRVVTCGSVIALCPFFRKGM